MSRFATGILAGSIIGAVGMTYLMSDNKTRRRMVRGQRRAMRKAEDLIDGVTDIF